MNRTGIIYGAGCYGTFFNWCLKYFSDPKFDVDLSLTSTGSAHDSPIQMISPESPFPFSSVSDYISSGTDNRHDITRMHWSGLLSWKDSYTESVTDRINLLEQSFDKIIFLMPTEETLLWIADNKFSKITTRKNLSEHFIDVPEVLKNLENWPVTDIL